MSLEAASDPFPTLLKGLAESLRARRAAWVENAPPGSEALVLAGLAAPEGVSTLVHLVRNDRQMAAAVAAIRFFAPEAQVLAFPAWDCLPYDRVGPHRDILAARVDVLTSLIAAPQATEGQGRILVTTAAAILQRLPPSEAFAGRVRRLAPGEGGGPEALRAFLADNGYLRVEAVDEPGEFALRGGIVDVFPAGAEAPCRLDFFGDELESLRSFDPLTQRSSAKLPEVILKPVGEVLLDEDSIARFRSGYRAAFGLPRGGDPLYEAISEGRNHAGMEHWLPLFYDRLETLFDYLPPETPVTLEEGIEGALEGRRETIREYYEARQELEDKTAGIEGGYHPLAPERLFLDEADWAQILGARGSAHFAPAVARAQEETRFDLSARRAPGFAEARTSREIRLFDAVRKAIAAEQAAGRRVLIAGYSAGSRARLAALLAEHGLENLPEAADWDAAQALPPGSPALVPLALESGFEGPGIAVITEQDILGERVAAARPRQRRAENFLTEVQALEANDIVVHVEHGIGRYEGLETLDVHGALHDCLKIIYHGGDRLFVPVETIDVLSRYGAADAAVELDRLGAASWQARRSRVKARLKEMAEELIRIAALRETRESEALEAQPGLYEEFAARFPYPETEDQDRAIAETLDDLRSGRPMDRLICGDVGFGKTEVALRAAFVTALSGRQVAVVVPTTLLARQHLHTFRQRFAGLPVKIAQLSRLTGASRSKEIKEELAKGQVDIVIGTHALLAESVRFRDLALLIIDEEQHFGVRQKERLKQLRAAVHVLSLSATPIPRTLQLALTGIKTMSLIATPPVDRLAVRTFVLPYDPVVVREAILRERLRGGQTFYVCPRIEHLGEVETRLKELVPEVKVGVAHGQMAARRLEQVMGDFYERRYDLLLATNIIESGLDVPTANTLIIHRSDLFGLAQLYQLRGRIGRAKVRAYAYLTVPQGRLLNPAALKRLEVMQSLDTLGAGFTLASHDLDIRGAGNLLGEEQSGHIREVGIELYQQMLEEAVAAARSGKGAGAEAPPREAFVPQINLGTSVLIPESYVADLNLRLGLYRRLAELVERREIEAFAAELIDRFGPLPDEVENLLQVMAIKRFCLAAGVEKVDAGPKGAVLTFHQDSLTAPEKLVAFVAQQPGRVQLRPDYKLVYRRNWERAPERLRGVTQFLSALAKALA